MVNKDRHFFGRSFELQAVDFLIKRGFKILDRNFYIRGGELDIVARKAKDIYFIEVRHRGKTSFASAFESIDQRKMRRIVKTAMVYVRKKQLDRDNYDFHFAVMSVNEEGIDILWDAFTLQDVGFYCSI